MRGWRIIKGFPDYRVTKDGRIFSMSSGKWIALQYNISAYVRVSLWKKNKRHWRFVHRLVALHFKKNPAPRRKIEVNHIDWDIHNNNSYNLEWVSSSENKQHNKKRWLDKKKQKIDWEKVFAETVGVPPGPEPQPVKIFIPEIVPGPIHCGDDPPF